MLHKINICSLCFRRTYFKLPVESFQNLCIKIQTSVERVINAESLKLQRLNLSASSADVLPFLFLFCSVDNLKASRGRGVNKLNHK